MNEQDTRKILDVKINSAATKEVLENIKSFLLSDSRHHIITLNPEMIVEAQKDSYFKNIINEADLSLADGTGILLANMLINGKFLPERIQGIDLVYRICEADFIKNKRIYLLGAGKGIAEETAKALLKKYPDLLIAGAEEGMSEKITNYKLQITNKNQGAGVNTQNSNNYEDLNDKLIKRINNAKPNILFVAFGAPKQEKWIYENIKKIPSVKLAIGVGGSFDFISGKAKRAPLILRKIGLEWLWRLIQERKRAKRIYNATFVFLWLLLKNRIKKT